MTQRIALTTLVSGLLSATARLRGDALILSVGERPYVVGPAGPIEIGTRPLPQAVVIDLLGQLLPTDVQAALETAGTVWYTLPQLPELPDDRFTVMASRVGTVRAEVRRDRAGVRRRPPISAGGHTSALLPVVLLIDDSADQLDMYTLVLSDSYHVLQASNGECGIDVALTNRPDIVVVDVHMPGIDGWEVCRRLRRDPRTATIPIIALTALRTPDLLDRATRAGAMDLLTKPCPADMLKARIDAVVGVTDSDR